MRGGRAIDRSLLPREEALVAREARRSATSVDLVLNTGCHFCVRLKYLKSGGGWSLRAGISKPSPLMK